MIEELRRELAEGGVEPIDVAMRYVERANGNASRNTYLHLDPADVIAQARALPLRFPDARSRPPLYGVPVSIKDCFDVAGTVTTFGSRFYARESAPAARDSAVAQRLREAGCVITGKTNLNALAYGITGENSEYGDCVQPRDASSLTGGSSGGAAASVQEGSAAAAVGTDTGGSIRVPAALCGLVGYRCSHSIAATWWREVWEGARHLAPSFDTPGLLLRDGRDLPLLGNVIFGVPFSMTPKNYRVGCVPESFLAGCEVEVVTCYRAWRDRWLRCGAKLEDFDMSGWEESVEIFSGIQAHEASKLHRGLYDQFEPSVARRRTWGASLTHDDVAGLHLRLARFKSGMRALLSRFDLLMMPCAPVSRLAAGEDHTAVRQQILRLTTPFSLAGLPAVTLPGESIGERSGTGVQIAAASGKDDLLLACVAWLTDGL